MKTIIAYLILIVVFISSCKKKEAGTDPKPVDTKKKDSALAITYDVKFITDWTNLHKSLIKSTAGFMPPVAARSLAYANLALFESLRPGIPEAMSLAGQLNGLDKLPLTDSTKEYHWALTASTSQALILKELFTGTSDKNQLKIDSLRLFYEAKYKTGLNDAAFQNSLKFGSEMANAILTYSKKDGGLTGYANNFPQNYTVPNLAGAWKPTSGQKTPLLPNWGNNRPFLIKNIGLDLVEKPITFSFDKTSDFYKEVRKVYLQGQILTDSQKNTAKFFDFGIGTISTPGHLLGLAQTLSIEKLYKVDKMAPLLAKLSLALNDAYILAWRSKYANNIMRPQTYINDAIDPKWRSSLGNPLYPEFPSDHAMAASVFKEIMSKEVAADLGFLDDSQKGVYDLRSYENLDLFVSDYSNSRIFGGVQTNMSSNAGIKAGKKVAENILTLKLK